MSQYLKELLKIGTTIDHQFIDEFYDILSRPEDQFSVPIDSIVAWLDIDRKGFLKHLKTNKHLIENKDYIIGNNKIKPIKHGGHNKLELFFSKDAFKTICMYTKSKQGDLVRNYFLEVEKFLERNKYVIIDHMKSELYKANLRIKQLELNQQPKQKLPNGGYVYVYKTIATDGTTKYKIGMTKDINSRIGCNSKN